MRAHGALIKSTGDLFLFDETGTIQERSHNLLAREALKHRDFLEFHRRDPSLEVRIGAPFRDRVSGNTVLWISRRLNGPGGRFAGVLAGTLDTGRWRQAFESFSIGLRSSINLFHADGTLMMRAPFVADRIGSNLAGTDNFKRFAASPSGTFVGASAIDGEERAYHFAHIGNTPLISMSRLRLPRYTRGGAGHVRQRCDRCSTRRDGSRAPASSVPGVAPAPGKRESLPRPLGCGRSHGHRQPSSFDEVLALEWSNATASGKPVSVIMLDVDHFKLFNDQYGHQAGDACLCDVAAALRKAVGRSEDLVARYGGRSSWFCFPARTQRAAPS